MATATRMSDRVCDLVCDIVDEAGEVVESAPLPVGAVIGILIIICVALAALASTLEGVM